MSSPLLQAENLSFLGRSPPVQWICDYLGLTVLPAHIDTVVLSLIVFHIIYTYLAEPGSRLIIPKRWSAFTERDKTAWKIAVVALVHSSFAGPLNLYILLSRRESRAARGVIERTYGYDDLAFQATNISLGYFAWHLVFMLLEQKKQGREMALHGLAGLVAIAETYQPYCSHILPQFLLWEITNIPHNLYRMFARLDMVTSTASIVNAFVWIASFFASRILFGTIVTLRRIHDFWSLLGTEITPIALGDDEFLAAERLRGLRLAPRPLSMRAFFWSMVGFMVLNGLNYMWFYMILRTTFRKLRKARDSVVEKQ